MWVGIIGIYCKWTPIEFVEPGSRVHGRKCPEVALFPTAIHPIRTSDAHSLSVRVIDTAKWASLSLVPNIQFILRYSAQQTTRVLPLVIILANDLSQIGSDRMRVLFGSTPTTTTADNNHQLLSK